MRFQFTSTRRSGREDTPKAQQILRASRRLLIRKGFADYSARSVAKEAKISLGALQYCFPTLHALLASTLEYVVNNYEAHYVQLERKIEGSAEARLYALLDYLVDDNWSPETRKIFFGIWALSVHSTFARRMMHEMYTYQIERVSGFIAAAGPHLSAQHSRDLATQLMAMIEGFCLFSERPTAGTLDKKDMQRLVRELAQRQLDSAELAATSMIA
ncbi:MAG: TetR/AcrR family transcriptional regulator [Proteobacteria bacterium]|nr:TetR/AcrR family transcriptional regulator [Pseudomonadota bacterium]